LAASSLSLSAITGVGQLALVSHVDAGEFSGDVL
jgi:hypothetical protein